MSALPNCPLCNSEYTYEDGAIFICPECSHEWAKDMKEQHSENERIIKDANGNVLQDGDTVTVIKELNPSNGFCLLSKHFFDKTLLDFCRKRS